MNSTDNSRLSLSQSGINELDVKDTSTSPRSSLTKGTFFAIGNPLLDMSIQVNPTFLQRYNLKENQIILASEEHNKLFDDINRKARYASGGSSQNIMRTIVWFLQQPGVASFMGCVGDDFEHTQLREIGEAAGLNTAYQVHENLNTGRCAILVLQSNQSMSMVASLGAAEAFTHDYLDKEENWCHIEQAKILCSEGYFLVSNREAFMRVCEHAHRNRKIFSLTLSAKYICDEPYGSRLLSALPYADVVFGREDEVKIFAQTQLGIESSDLHTLIKAIQEALKWNKNRPRLVVVIKPKRKTTIGTNEGIKEYEWKLPNNIVDTHGCEDAFTGGFLAYLALNKSVDECARAGLYCAYENLQQLGCQYPSKVNYNPASFFQNEDE